MTDSFLRISARGQLDVLPSCFGVGKKVRSNAGKNKGAILTELRSSPSLVKPVLPAERLPVLPESLYACLLRKTTEKKADAVRSRLSKAA